MNPRMSKGRICFRPEALQQGVSPFRIAACVYVVTEKGIPLGENFGAELPVLSVVGLLPTAEGVAEHVVNARNVSCC